MVKNTSQKHYCNVRWGDLMLNSAVRILVGMPGKFSPCLRKFMCLQNKAKYSSPKKVSDLFARDVRASWRDVRDRTEQKHFCINEAPTPTV